MNVLLIGRDAKTEQLLAKLGQGHAITHCADGAAAIAELGSGSTRYDWIVVQGMARTLSSMEIASAIRAMGVWAPIAFLCDAEQFAPTVCAAPRERKHVATLSPPRAERWAQSAGTELLFEYHAPIKRRARGF